jgi:hypothetical protein
MAYSTNDPVQGAPDVLRDHVPEHGDRAGLRVHPHV